MSPVDKARAFVKKGDILLHEAEIDLKNGCLSRLLVLIISLLNRMLM